MEEKDILSLWKAFDKKLESHLALNRKNAEDITRIKVQSLLASMKPIKIFTLGVGILWVSFVYVLIFGLFDVANPFFLISAGIQVLLTQLAIVLYFYQLILISQTDINQPVVKTQEKIASLKSSTIWVARILFLQLPVWTTFYWNHSMLENGNMGLYIIQVLVTGSFTLLAVWLFFNIKYENRNKRWFRLIFSGKEWQPVLLSMELLHQIREDRNGGSSPLLNG